MINYKKAEMGVGTLIVFIAMLLVAAVAAGVLIQTISSLQEKSLSTGKQAESQISTNAQTIEVSASDGSTGEVTDFQQLMKLAPGSDPIKLDQIIFTFNTKDTTATLKYKGTDSECEKNNIDGFNTWNAEVITSGIGNTTLGAYPLAEDLDDDGTNDQIYVNATNLVFNLSTAGYIDVEFDAGGDAQTDAPLTLNVVNTAVTSGATTYAYVTISGTTTTNGLLDGATATVTPYRLGQGYFAVLYEQQGTNHVPGNLQRGDLIRLCYEAPGAINEDEEVRLNFIPKIGTATLTQFVTPDVISTERVYLYP